MDIDLKFNSVCQCCLAERGFMKNMVTEVFQETKLIDRFKTCLGIDLLADQTETGASKKICPKCEINFKITIEFHELCHTSQKILKERLNFTGVVKDEPVSDDEPLILYTQKPATGTRRGGTNFTQVFVQNQSETDLKVKEEIATVKPSSPSLADICEVDDEINEVKVNPEDLNISQDEDDNADFFDTSMFATSQDSDCDDEAKTPILKSNESEYKDQDIIDQIASMTAKYQCYYCDQYLPTHTEYINHRDNHVSHLNKVSENRQIDRKCFVCKKEVVGYVKHLYSEHIDFRPHECIQCNQTFRTQMSLKNHLYSHISHKSIKCMGCPLKFKSNSLLRYHLVNVKHKKNMYHCLFCGLGFMQFIGLDQHFHTDHKQHSHKHFYPCFLCKRVFTFNKHALKHDCTPTQEPKKKKRKPFLKVLPPKSTEMHKCPNCTEEFTSADEMECHKIALCVARFICPKPGCGKVFKNPRALGSHAHKCQRSNTSHICDQCGFTTISVSALTMHKTREHDPNYKKVVTPLNCPHAGCKKVLHSKNALEKHIGFYHAERQYYECHLCPKKFCSLTSIRTHVVEHVPNSNELLHFDCHVCGKKYASLHARHMHMRVHRTDNMNFKCSKCPITFQYLPNLRTHEKRIHEGRYYECCFCHNHYSGLEVLKYHMFEHRGFKPFSCPSCPSQFVRQYLFVTHLKKHGITFDKTTHGYVELEDQKKLLRSCERSGFMNVNQPESVAMDEDM